MRHPLALLIPVLWVIWGVYWVIASAFAKPVRRRESAASRASHVVPLALGAALLASWRLAGRALDARFLPRGLAWFWLGTAMVVAGLAFAVAARRHLGGNWSGIVTLKQDHTLTRSGPYRVVRHPIYTGMLLAVLGTAVAEGEWRGLVAFAAVLVAFLRKVRIEEQFMLEAFGEEYARYRRQVPALLPWVR
jgi:protein-S-isoprenylcysteine O-methyltransferase Ste14